MHTSIYMVNKWHFHHNYNSSIDFVFELSISYYNEPSLALWGVPSRCWLVVFLLLLLCLALRQSGYKTSSFTGSYKTSNHIKNSIVLFLYLFKNHRILARNLNPQYFYKNQRLAAPFPGLVEFSKDSFGGINKSNNEILWNCDLLFEDNPFHFKKHMHLVKLNHKENPHSKWVAFCSFNDQFLKCPLCTKLCVTGERNCPWPQDIPNLVGEILWIYTKCAGVKQQEVCLKLRQMQTDVLKIINQSWKNHKRRNSYNRMSKCRPWT